MDDDDIEVGVLLRICRYCLLMIPHYHLPADEHPDHAIYREVKRP